MGAISPLLSYDVIIVTWVGYRVDQGLPLRRNNPPAFPGGENALLAACKVRADNRPASRTPELERACMTELVQLDCPIPARFRPRGIVAMTGAAANER